MVKKVAKLGKKAKVSLIIVAVVASISLIIGGRYIMQKKAEDYILREARVGLKVYFEKYYNGVDPDSIKLKIEYSKGMTTGPCVEGYVNGDKDMWISCSVIRLPKDEWRTPQDELGMVISDGGMSGKLGDMLKYEYSFANSNRKPIKKPSELIPKSEVEKAKKDRDLLNYIPEMRSY